MSPYSAYIVGEIVQSQPSLRSGKHSPVRLTVPRTKSSTSRLRGCGFGRLRFPAFPKDSPLQTGLLPLLVCKAFTPNKISKKLLCFGAHSWQRIGALTSQYDAPASQPGAACAAFIGPRTPMSAAAPTTFASIAISILIFSATLYPFDVR